MRCKSCQYDLRDLTELRCPECGRRFDPQNSTTFLPAEYRSKRRELVIDLLFFVVPAGVVIVIIAWHSIGEIFQL